MGSVHLVFPGTLVLGFTMFLADLVLLTVLLLFLAGTARPLALTVLGLFRRVDGFGHRHPPA